MDENLLNIYQKEEPLLAQHLIDTNSGAGERGICALPFVRQSDQKTIFIPVNLIGNLFVSNGMSAGNTWFEAKVQSLCEIFERAVKNEIILQEICLPDIPDVVLQRYPKIQQGIKKLQDEGFDILVKDASLGGKFPVLCVTLINPRTGGVFASFGCHPKFAVALERSLTELMQGRSFEGLNDVPRPTFSHFAINEPNNIVEHFVDSTGVISWKFFSDQTDFQYSDWDFSGNTEQEFHSLMGIFKKLGKDVYIAEYSDLKAKACRILVPGYSEIYPFQDLIWDNNNKGAPFRRDILEIHSLSNNALLKLCEKLEQSDLDDYLPVGELIGVAFDDNTPWEKCTVGELKGLIYLALGHLKKAKEQVEAFLHYNDNTPEREKFYQVLDVVLNIEISSALKIENFKNNLNKMYGPSLVENAINSCQGKIKFFGLTPTDLSLKGIDKHLKLIDSYKKIHLARKNVGN